MNCKKCNSYMFPDCEPEPKYGGNFIRFYYCTKCKSNYTEYCYKSRNGIEIKKSNWFISQDNKDMEK